MSAYAIATLRNVRMGPDIVRYLEHIDGTLAPFSGRFIVHGGPKTILEGSWPGDVVVIAFPDLEAARAWYSSAEYRSIKSLRTDHSDTDVILIAGVDGDHVATDVLLPSATKD